MMDPNKRGNPPFEPSSYAAGLERRVKRHNEWSQMACQLRPLKPSTLVQIEPGEPSY